MSKIEWDPSLETGDTVVDQEHRKIYFLIDELVTRQHDPKFLEAAIGDIIEYAGTHFAHEESLMARYDYPDTQHHQALHAAFAEEAERLGDECIAGVCLSESGLAEFMLGWLNGHINAEDRRLVEHIQSHGHPAAG